MRFHIIYLGDAHPEQDFILGDTYPAESKILIYLTWEDAHSILAKCGVSDMCGESFCSD